MKLDLSVDITSEMIKAGVDAEEHWLHHGQSGPKVLAIFKAMLEAAANAGYTMFPDFPKAVDPNYDPYAGPGRIGPSTDDSGDTRI